jgi:hypothetical protein
VAGIFVLKAIRLKPTWYELITIDGNRGYNIIKREKFRQDNGTKISENNYTLKQYADGTWFISERERIEFSYMGRKLPKPRVVERTEITRVEFNVPKPDPDRFRLQFPKGTQVADTLWYYRHHTDFLVGCLSEAKHTQEDQEVTSLLERSSEKAGCQHCGGA